MSTDDDAREVTRMVEATHPTGVDRPHHRYGYTTEGNTRLQQARRMAYRMGDGPIDRYPPQSGATADYTPTMRPDDDSVDDRTRAGETIERIRKRIKGQSAPAVRSIASEWSMLHAELSILADRLQQASDGLRPTWSGPASNVFFANAVGATLQGLDNWAAAADANRAALDMIADIIEVYQAKIDDVWQRYLDRIAWARDQWESGHVMAVPPGVDIDHLDQVPGDEGRELREAFVSGMKTMENEFTEEAQQVEYEMSRAYWDIVIDGNFNAGSSTVYEGPTDAVKPPPSAYFPAPPSLGGMPGMSGALPAGMPGAPVAPTTPALSLSASQPADLPRDVPVLQGNPAAPTAPSLPGAPPALSGGLPPLAVAPVLPGAPPTRSDQQIVPAAGGLALPGAAGGKLTPPNAFGGKLPGAAPPAVPAPGSAPGGSGSPPPPALAKAPGKSAPALRKGVLGAGRNAPGAPPVGQVAKPRSGASAVPPVGAAPEDFGGGAPVGSAAPPVVGRPRPGSRRSAGASGLPGRGAGAPGFPAAGSSLGGAPPGAAAPPVLGARRTATRRSVGGVPTAGGSGPVATPSGHRSPARSPARSSPQPGTPLADSAWVSRPTETGPNPTSPVLSNNRANRRPAEAAAPVPTGRLAAGLARDAAPPVLGRTVRTKRAAGGAEPVRRVVRRRPATAGEPTPQAVQAVQPAAPATPVGDEEVFAVDTPGGGVLTQPAMRATDDAPKPTLGAAG
jgi:hypothetical protein